MSVLCVSFLWWTPRTPTHPPHCQTISPLPQSLPFPNTYLPPIPTSFPHVQPYSYPSQNPLPAPPHSHFPTSLPPPPPLSGWFLHPEVNYHQTWAPNQVKITPSTTHIARLKTQPQNTFSISKIKILLTRKLQVHMMWTWRKKNS